MNLSAPASRSLTRGTPRRAGLTSPGLQKRGIDFMRLWLLRETEKARQYSKLDPERHLIEDSDRVWIPKSIIEHTTKRGHEHEVTLPDWFIEKEGL